MYVRQARRRPGYYRNDASRRQPRFPTPIARSWRGRDICSAGGQSISGSIAAVYSSSDSGTGHPARRPDLHTHLVASRIPFVPPGKIPRRGYTLNALRN
jgi:hypothetical protein